MNATMDARTSDARTTSRNGGFDALRASMTQLVLFHHTAITCGAIGGWFYREIKPDGSLSSMLLVFFCTVNQAYFMGAFFLLAGYFTPAALDAKGTLRYLRDRALRLGIPLAVFGWLLGPVTVALAKTQQGQPFVDSLLALLRRGAFVIGPLWFAWALLIFGVGAVAWRALIPKGEVIAEPKQRPFPSNTTLVVVAVATGSLAFALRLVWPVGSEAFGLQLGYFASYTVLFVAGCSAAGQRWLKQIPLAPARTWRRVALLALPILPVVVLLGPALPALRGEAAGG